MSADDPGATRPLGSASGAEPRSRHAFSAWSDAWPAAFAREAGDLRALLGAVIIDIHHIGSTSVPGLAAKATIDMLPLVTSLDEVDDATGRMTAAGYRAFGEFGLPGRRYFTKEQHGVRTHHIHCYRVGDPEVERHLAFCAYLRAHPAACEQYAALKRALFARHADNMIAYNDDKDAWIKAIEPRAIAWYRATPNTGDDGTDVFRARTGDAAQGRQTPTTTRAGGLLA